MMFTPISLARCRFSRRILATSSAFSDINWGNSFLVRALSIQKFELNVELRNTPFSSIIFSASSSARVPCSMVRTPAATAFFTPLAPWAWAAVCLPTFLPSLTTARISSSSSCGAPGTPPGFMMAPVAMTFKRSAPCLSCSLAALRFSSTPSAS